MKPRLLIILNRLIVGGPAVDVLPLADALRNDFEIHILYGSKEPDEVEPAYLVNRFNQLKLVHIPAFRRAVNLKNDFIAWRQVGKYIREFQPDIVHTHGAKSGLLGRFLAKRYKVPLVVHTFHGHLFHSYFNRLVSRAIITLERAMLRYTDVVIAISTTQKQELIDALGPKAKEKIRVIPLGVNYIDASLRDHYRKAFRRTYQVAEDEVCIGMFGRMAKIKNPLFFLQIVQRIREQYNELPVRFFVIGDGTEIPEMKRFLTNNKIAFSESNDIAPVNFTSWVQNIQSVLEGLDVVVLTSLNEGTPLSLVEAQICGKPVVAVNVGGVRDTFVNNETGFLVPDHNVDGFVTAIRVLVVDSALRRQMGEKAMLFGKEHFSKKSEIESLRAVYLQSISRK